MIKNLNRKWSALKLFDKAVIGFFLILDALILIFHNDITHFVLRTLAYFVIIAFIIYIIPVLDNRDNKILHFIRYWYIIFAITLIYWEVGHLIHMIFPYMFDSHIISFEKSIFGVLPNVWIQKFETPLLTEVMQISYAIYWATIPVGAALFYFNKKYKAFEYLLFFVLITFFLSYLMFIFIPAAGPRFIIADQIYASYDGLFFTPYLRHFVEFAGLHGGAFPSSHVAVAIIVLFFVWKYYPKLGKRVFLPAVIALSLATVYGQYHYISDVICGAALGILIGTIGIRYTQNKLKVEFLVSSRIKPSV